MALIPLKPMCSICGPERASDKPLLKCGRCKSVYYCSREHQREDHAVHGPLCGYVHKWRENIKAEKATLLRLIENRELPEDLFTAEVGHFWAIEATRPYMLAKSHFIRGVFTIAQHGAVELGLAQCLDCLRLCRADNLGLREVAPMLMLQLGQVQESYNFIKWYATVDMDGGYDWYDMSLPFLDIKEARIAEDIVDGFKTQSSVFHLAALTYIKFKDAEQLGNVVEVLRLVDSDTPIAPIQGVPVLENLMGPDGKEQRKMGIPLMQTMQQKLLRDAVEAFRLVHAKNKHYWPAMLDPLPLQFEADPGSYVPGDRFEVKQWLPPHSLLWQKEPRAMAFIRENLQKV